MKGDNLGKGDRKEIRKLRFQGVGLGLFQDNGRWN